jgi:hypothetical protein
MKPQSSPQTCHTLHILCTKMDENHKSLPHACAIYHTNITLKMDETTKSLPHTCVKHHIISYLKWMKPQSSLHTCIIHYT